MCTDDKLLFIRIFNELDTNIAREIDRLKDIHYT